MERFWEPLPERQPSLKLPRRQHDSGKHEAKNVETSTNSRRLERTLTEEEWLL